LEDTDRIQKLLGCENFSTTSQLLITPKFVALFMIPRKVSNFVENDSMSDLDDLSLMMISPCSYYHITQFLIGDLCLTIIWLRKVYRKVYICDFTNSSIPIELNSIPLVYNRILHPNFYSLNFEMSFDTVVVLWPFWMQNSKPRPIPSKDRRMPTSESRRYSEIYK
jgi:hypothetical protein